MVHATVEDLVRDANVSCFRPEGGNCVGGVVAHVVAPVPQYHFHVRGDTTGRGDLIALRLPYQRIGRAYHSVRGLNSRDEQARRGRRRPSR